jgi:hypothetical protein
MSLPCSSQAEALLRRRRVLDGSIPGNLERDNLEHTQGQHPDSGRRYVEPLLS